MPAMIESMWDAEREPWWQGLGGKFANVTKKRLTPAEAVKAAGMHIVEKRPLYAYLGTDESPQSAGDFTPLPSHDTYALVDKNTKRMLKTVKSRYQVIQPLEMALFLITLIDAGELVLVSGGEFLDGIGRFFCAQLPEDIRIAGLADEVIKQYVTFLDLLGMGAGEIFGTSVRSVCMNTVLNGIRQGRSIGSSWKVNHDGQWRGRIAEAREALQFVYSQTEEFKAEMEALLEKAANEKTLKAVYEQVWPIPEEDKPKARATWKLRHEEIHTVWRTSPNLENVRDTQYGVFNALSEWAEHGRKYYGTGGDKTKIAAKRGEEILLGRTRDIETAALQALLVLPSVKKVNLSKAGKSTAKKLVRAS